MKKLTTVCLIIVSLTLFAKNEDFKTVDLGNNPSSNYNDGVVITDTMDDNIFEIEMYEQDTPFDFDHKAYLPKGFNPFRIMSSKNTVPCEYFNEDNDETFDFDMKKYLPENFNPYEEVSILEHFGLLHAEDDEKFDFDPNEYLPKGFNAYSEDELIMEEYELLQIEPDAPFDFNTVDYLTNN